MAARYLRVPIQGDLVGLEVNTILRRHLHLSGTVLRRIKWLSDGIMWTASGSLCDTVSRRGKRCRCA